MNSGQTDRGENPRQECGEHVQMDTQDDLKQVNAWTNWADGETDKQLNGPPRQTE